MATENHLIPNQELSTGQAAGIRNAIIESVVAKVAKELSLAPDKLVVRDIQPSVDMGMTAGSWFIKTGATAGAYETLTSGTMAVSRYVVLYGVIDFTDVINVSKVKITIGNSIKAVWNLENLYATSTDSARVGISPSPVVIPQNTLYKIERWVINANAASAITYKGFVVENIGKTLSP